MQAQHIMGEIRPSQTPYSPQTTSNYPHYQSLNSTAYLPGNNPSRGAVPPDAHSNPHYHHPHNQPTSMAHASQGRPASGSRVPTQSYAPYPRPPLPEYEQPPVETTEPQIKKKRKRADARQLEVLNGTYHRTAFPSTEERTQLAKDLDMSARSVQIWFQNKRQAARQGGRNVAASSGAPEPTPTPPAQGPGYPGRSGSVLMSPMVETPGPSYSSRSPPPAGRRSGQTPSPPSGRTHADNDRHWSGPRGY